MTTTKRKDGSGVFFQNDKKTKDSSPDYTGTLLLDQDYGRGTEIKLSGWRKTTPRGHLISISINNWKADETKQWPKPVSGDDDIPF